MSKLLVFISIVNLLSLPFLNAQRQSTLFVTYRDFVSTAGNIGHPHFDGSDGNTSPATHNQMVSSFLVEEEGTGLFKPDICEPALRFGGRCGTNIVNPNLAKTAFRPNDDSLTKQESEFRTWYRDHFQNSRLDNRRSGSLVTLTESPASPGTFNFKSNNFFPLVAGVNSDETFSETRTVSNITRNYHFTTEIHTFFQYKGKEKFTFTGDDDVFVYVDNILRMYLGGVHNPISGTIDLDSLNLTKGNIYPLAMYHAERQCCGSNFELTTSLVSPCNAASAESVRQISFPGSKFAENTKLVGSSIVGGNRIRLVSNSNVFNKVGYTFYTIQQNIGPGFVSKFNFIASPNSQGFAFHVHDGSIVNMNGGFGSNLGIRNFQKSLAVVFDLIKKEIRVHASLESNNVSDETRIAFAKLHPGADFSDNQSYEVIVQYLFEPPVLEIYVDKSLYIQKRNFIIENVMGSRAAFVGFTSTTGTNAETSGRVEISSWAFDTVSVRDRSTILHTNVSQVQTILADNRERARFLISNVDGCGNDVEFGGFANRVSAIFTSQDKQTLNGTVIDANNGSYLIEFETDIISEFSLNISFGENCQSVNNNNNNNQCFTAYVEKAIKSLPVPLIPEEPPASEGLPQAALTGIGISIGVVGFLSGLAGIFFLSKRRRWLKEKKFIEEGKLAKLQEGLNMSGDNVYDEISRKLQVTKEEINLRKGANLGLLNLEDDISKLEQQKAELTAHLRVLKNQNNRFSIFRSAASKPLAPPPVPKRINFPPTQPLDI